MNRGKNIYGLGIPFSARAKCQQSLPLLPEKHSVVCMNTMLLSLFCLLFERVYNLISMP